MNLHIERAVPKTEAPVKVDIIGLTRHCEHIR